MMRAFPFDLHVLSTPPAFVLSQDQTLQKNKQKITGKKQRNQQNKNKQQTANTKNLFWCPHPCSCTNNNSFHQMTHYRVLKQHHHPQPHPKPGKGRKQRPHKYTNPTTKPQTTTSQQQKPGKTIQSLLACALDVTNTGTWAHTSIDIIMVAAKLYAGALTVVSTCSLL